ncbi:hypothetical protein [Shewanella woodyi]|uniref:hypothetical protein n=1 Tax=Shewanella woodyi TaxID=60961 RepID=UPI0007F8B381|nr:hypothetical protein [Shewanella woodyi]
MTFLIMTVDNMREVEQVTIIGNTQDTALWIWENLVPKSGRAASVQGEVMRCIELLAWEAQNNSNLNWDKSFDDILAYLKETYLGDTSPMSAFFDENTKSQIESDLHRLGHFILPTELDSRVYNEELPYIEEDLYARLTENLVSFCRQYPSLLPR